MSAHLVASAAVAVLLASSAHARAWDCALHRGPTGVRDEQLLAQPRLTLPAVSPCTTGEHRWSLATSTLWSSTFSWDQDVAGEQPKARRYLLDGETLTVDTTLRRRLGRKLDAAVRLPLRWRGGGILDGAIDWWHRTLGFPNGGRPYFRRDAFRVEGETTDGGTFSWNDRAGAGLGDAELEVLWRVVDGGEDRTAIALLGRATAPTGTGPFAGNGPAAAAQIALATPLARRFDVYVGLGGTAQRRGPVRGVSYEPLRGQGFLAIEWRPSRRLSLVAETDAATRLVTSVSRYPGSHWMLNVSGRLDLGRRARLDLGFTEGLVDQASTTDFAVYAGIALRP